MVNSLKNVSCLKGAREFNEARLWKKWIAQIPEIRSAFQQYMTGWDPLHLNELASVGVLVNAASQAGFLSLMEYVAYKRAPTRGRPFRSGRCDLWIADSKKNVSWAFELKQYFAKSGTRSSTFKKKMEAAIRDSKNVDKNEATKRVACLIIVPDEDAMQGAEMERRFDDLCKLCDDVHLAFRVGGGLGAVWFAFSFVE